MHARLSRRSLSDLVRRTKNEAGFTLPELLIAITVMFTVVGVLTTAIIVGLRTTDATALRLGESHDAQHTSAYLANDVQSALRITSSTCGAAGALINFSFDGSNNIASYHHGVADDETRLTRTLCNSGGTEVSKVVLAHFAASATPAVLCDGVSCNPATAPQPTEVELTVTTKSGYAFTLKGVRRAFAAGGPGDALDDAALIAIVGEGEGGGGGGGGGGSDSDSDSDGDSDEGCGSDDGGPCPDGSRLHVLDDGILDVDGRLMVDCCGTEVPNPQAVWLEGDGRLLTNKDLRIYKYTTPGGCTGCNSTRLPSHPPKAFAGHISDPLAGLPAPSTAGLVARTGCSSSPCQPGVYASRLNITGHRTFNPGTYYLRQGLSISGSGTITGSGVFLYIEDNTLSISGNPAVTLSPSTTDGDPYKGILAFQARTNRSAMLLRAGTRAVALNGRIYAPNVDPALRVWLRGSSGGLSVKSIISTAYTVEGTGSGTRTVRLGPV